MIGRTNSAMIARVLQLVPVSQVPLRVVEISRRGPFEANHGQRNELRELWLITLVGPGREA
jgi:hypothetical protein